MSEAVYTGLQAAAFIAFMICVAMAVTSCAAISCIQNTNACGLN